MLRFIYILTILTAGTTSADCQQFTDVPASAQFSGTVNLMYNRFITTGCVAEPLQYCPGNRLTRWMGAVFVIRSLYSAMNANGDPDSFPYNTSPYFSDVPFYDYNNPDLTPNGHPAFKYIQRMK